MERLQSLQRRILEEILIQRDKKDTGAEKREVTLEEEITHSIGCARLAQVTALKRNLNPELAGMIGVSHDYGRILSGVKERHAEIGAAPLKRLLSDTGLFSSREIEIIISAVENHSRKDEISGPYEELIKDVDVLENYLAGKKPKKIPYEKRLHSILKELSLTSG